MTCTEPRMAKHTHRADIHGVHSLDCIVFTVPNLDEAARFYDAFGLLPERIGSRLDLRTQDHPQRWASLFEAPGSKRLQYLRFACFAEDFDAITARVERLRVPRAASHALGDDSGLLADASGRIFCAGGSGAKEHA